MARMTRTIISLPEEDKKWIEIEAKRRRISGAAVIRMSVRETRLAALIGSARGRGAGATQVAEKPAEYGHDALAGITDPKELRRRAAAAAGQFTSGVPDLSIEHDRYAWGESGDAGDTKNDTNKESGARSDSGAGRGARSGRREGRRGKKRAR